MHVYLETPRIVLRRFTAGEVGLLHELDNDPQVMRYLNGGRPVSLSESEAQLAAFLQYYQTGPRFGFWAASEVDTDRFTGWFHFRPGVGAGPAEPELGYRLHQFAWGQGIATEVSQALVNKGFEELAADRVYAQTMAVNLGSRRVMEKVGMGLVKTFHADWPERVDGDEEGEVEYEISRSEWENYRPNRS